ncbi:hypothetical protein LTR09_008171 [Extremus antarcticus]|uniref:Uncharacterized protein n=1 Tax=Extremus antarcticus TaxID=702011 RepID=A0AAJ0GAB6_9PEZI|nr:hypothetical protein LTR09_008171 [Extremus antarcticus]
MRAQAGARRFQPVPGQGADVDGEEDEGASDEASPAAKKQKRMVGDQGDGSVADTDAETGRDAVPGSEIDLATVPVDDVELARSWIRVEKARKKQEKVDQEVKRFLAEQRLAQDEEYGDDGLRKARAGKAKVTAGDEVEVGSGSEYEPDRDA